MTDLSWSQLCQPDDTAFGFHNFFKTTAGNSFYVAVVPGLTDTCLKNACTQASTGGDAGCSLKLAQTQLQRGSTRKPCQIDQFADIKQQFDVGQFYDPPAKCDRQHSASGTGGRQFSGLRSLSRRCDADRAEAVPAKERIPIFFTKAASDDLLFSQQRENTVYSSNPTLLGHGLFGHAVTPFFRAQTASRFPTQVARQCRNHLKINDTPDRASMV